MTRICGKCFSTLTTIILIQIIMRITNNTPLQITGILCMFLWQLMMVIVFFSKLSIITLLWIVELLTRQLRLLLYLGQVRHIQSRIHVCEATVVAAFLYRFPQKPCTNCTLHTTSVSIRICDKNRWFDIIFALLFFFCLPY